MEILCPTELKIHHLSEDEIEKRYGVVINSCPPCMKCGKCRQIKRISTYVPLVCERNPPCFCSGFSIPPLRNYHNFFDCSEYTLLDYACFLSERLKFSSRRRSYYYFSPFLPLSLTLFELKYRGLLPSVFELQVAFDFCIEKGIEVQFLSFIEVWRIYMLGVGLI